MCTERLDDTRGEANAGAADEDVDGLDEDEEIEDQDSLLLDEDEDAPNLVLEGHPQRVLAGRIEILEKIGEGGMGAVWRGVHLKLERVVAVKILDETLQLRPDGRERFIREARALALLDHRNVVRIHDCDELPEGKLYLCMELLAGETLRAIIKRRQPLDPLEVIDAGLQVCDAVQAAHDRGILHRDLTPSNIIRLGDTTKTIKVIDWGLCKYLDLFYVRSTQKYATPPGSRLVTPLGCRFGTPEYMAPEMILKENPGPPSFCTDVYALAVVLYELLTGHHPFARGDRKRARPVRDFLPDFEYDDLETALRAALRYQSEARTQTMAELRDGLDMARECLLAQRESASVRAPVPPPASPEVVASTATPPAQDDTAEREGGTAPIDKACTRPDAPQSADHVAAAADAARPEPPPELARVLPLSPRRRIGSTALAAMLGLVVGVGVTMAAQPKGHVQPATELVALARLDREWARASAAERRADRCEAELATRTQPTEPPTSPMPAPSSPMPAPSSPMPTPAETPSPAFDQAATRVLAAGRGPNVRRPAPQKSSGAMNRLALNVRACAREGGIPEGPLTVQVRRQGGVIDSVKVLKFSKDHPAVACINEVVREADLPSSDRPLEDFTFPK